MLAAAAGRLVLSCPPTYSPWLNSIEMRWRHWRRGVTHCELITNLQALLEASRNVFERYNRGPGGVRSILGAYPA